MLSIKFKSLLTELKLTPEDFGNKIGVGKSSIYKLLRGDTKKITRAMAEKISGVFPQYTPQYLVELNFDTKKDIIDTPEIFMEKEGIRFTENEVVDWLCKNIEHLRKHNTYFGLVMNDEINKGIKKVLEEKGFKMDVVKDD
jgi:plasmid maintenance system antidote protein VapI